MFATLKNGTQVLIRPITSDDKAALAESYSHLSPETQRLRFLSPKPRLTSADLRYLTEVDGHDHVALVAVTVARPEEIVAVGRFVRLREDPLAAEFAIVVGDPYQGLGLGTELAQRLAAEARAHGVRRFTATILSENVAVRRLLDHIAAGLGSRGKPAYGGVTEVVAELAAKLRRVAQRFILTVRDGPRVERSVYGSVAEALDALADRVRDLEQTVRRETVNLGVQRFEPVHQVAARVEVSGPGRFRPAFRAGIDVRGDGSSEAYLGRGTRATLEQKCGESAVKTLRRALRERAKPG